MKDLVKGVALLLGGAVLGAAAALLLTPKTGEQVREQIKDITEDAKKRAQDYCDQLKKDLAEVVADIKEAKAEEPKAEDATAEVVEDPKAVKA